MTLLLSGAPTAETNGSMDKPKRHIADCIKLGVVNPFHQAVMLILEDADPIKPQLNLHTKINSKKKA